MPKTKVEKINEVLGLVLVGVIVAVTLREELRQSTATASYHWRRWSHRYAQRDALRFATNRLLYEAFCLVSGGEHLLGPAPKDVITVD